MMRPFVLVLALAGLVIPGNRVAVAQEIPTEGPVRVLPPIELPRITTPHLRRSFDGRDDRYTTSLDAWLSHVDDLRGSLSEAVLGGDSDLAEELLTESMSELALLMRQPDARSDARFVRAYADILSAYEAFYGEKLPEESFYDELFAARDELAGLLGELENPLGTANLDVEVTPIVSTVPMTVNRTVASTMEWLRNRPNTLKNWLTRAHTYFPMIEKIFAEEEVPDELKYLAMIESGLRPAVKSRARAVGMWQFIAATGAYYGLSADRWVDERKDPEKATRAAAKHLRDLYNQYGDWHIALAGYNCSPRCIRRAINSAKATGVESPTYWDMYPYLPRETRGYVPQFVATALMLSNPSAYGLSTDEIAPVYEYELVPVRGSLALGKVAQMAGTELETIEFLNPALHGGYVPRSRDPYPLRLPVGTSSSFLEAYASLPTEALIPPGEYKVKKGDFLGRIAARYGVTVSELKRTNGLRSDRLRIGQVLTVPVAEYDSPVPGAEVTEAQPVLVRYGELELRPVAPSEPFVGDIVVGSGSAPSVPVVAASLREPASTDDSTARTANPASDEKTTTGETTPVAVAANPAPAARTVVTYRIRRGDTLIDIARKYGVSVSDLREWNGLRGSSIKAGARLKLYQGTAEVAAGATATETARTTSRPAPDAPAESIVYRVRPGDTLSKIATAHGVTVTDLRAWNQLRGSVIRAGQRLTVYPSGTGTVSQTHKVVRGDNLFDIARRYGVTVDDLKSWNGLSSSRINPGDEIRIVK